MCLNWNLQYHSSAIHVSLVLLSSTEAGLQRALNSFSDAYDTAEIKNENKHGQTKVVHFSRNPDQCLLQVNGATLKQIEKIKYLGVPFTNDGRQDKKLDTRIGNVVQVSFALNRVSQIRIVEKGKALAFKTLFVPILTYSNESCLGKASGVRKCKIYRSILPRYNATMHFR